jgi:redox-sensitive bicupin YhaK (pirin superfamily)
VDAQRQRHPAREALVAGPFELIQLWINSPAAHKGDGPSYFPLRREDTPRVVTDEGRVAVNVIAGSLLGVSGRPSLSPVNAATLEVQKGGRVVIPLPPAHNAFLYVLDGGLQVGSTGVSPLHLVAFKNDGDGVGRGD